MLPPGPNLLRRLNNRAFTLVEVMVTVALIAVLALISVISYSKWVAHSENVVCLRRMKDIGVALGNYTVTNDGWPQMPASMENAEEKEFVKWWIEKMKPYGVAQSTWLCPTDDKERKKAAKIAAIERDEYEATYIPTDFDDGRDTPYKWRQPWLIERSSYHGNGQNVLMPDGSIRPFLNPMSQVPTKKK